MGARILLAMSVLIAAGSSVQAVDTAVKKPADKPAPLERSEIDTRAARVAFDASKLGSELWKDADFKGTFRLYQGTLLALQPMLDHRPKLAAFVKDRLERAQDMPVEKGAFVLREALDAIRKDVAESAVPVPKKAALWERLGGEKVVKAVVHDFVEAALKDPKVNFTRDGKYKLDAKALAQLKEHLVELISEVGRGPLDYAGRDIKKTHAAMKITGDEFDAMVGHLAGALKKYKVPQPDADELVKLVKTVKPFVAP